MQVSAAMHNLLPEVRQALAEALEAREGAQLRDLELFGGVSRPYSEVAFLRAATSAGDRRLVLKKVVHHEDNLSLTTQENQALVEYRALTELHPFYRDLPGCDVPEPILVLPEREAYLMRFVEGRLLSDCFGAAKLYAMPSAFERLAGQYRLCGVWLKRLQERTGTRRAGRAALDYTVERTTRRLEMLEEPRASRIPPKLTVLARELLERQLALVRDEEVLVTGRHGDFGSWNIMAGADGITVFDFLGYREDLVPIDLLKMLMNFEVERSYLAFSGRRIDLLRRAFLEGYGPLPEVARPILVICEILHRVCSLVHCVDQTRNPLRRIEADRVVRGNLAWFEDGGRGLLWDA